MTRCLSLVAVLMAGTAAHAAEPVGADAFNFDAGIDLAALGPDTFADIVGPAAAEEGGLTFFDFTNSFGPLFQEHLIPAFEEKTGLAVDYIRGDGNTAVQQLVAALNAGRAAPADVYFIGSGSSFSTLLAEDAIANIALHEVLPSATNLDPALATVAAGNVHGGIYLPFHRNQTSIVYNSDMVGTEELPLTVEALLDYATANPGAVAVTNPTRGGSGNGFLQSVANAVVEGEDCRAVFADYEITREAADAWAAGECAAPLWAYYTALLPVVELTNGNSDTLNLIANGAAAIGTGWEDMAYDFLGRGLLPPSTRQALLETGQVGGGDGMFLPVGAENVAAGLAFLDFMISHEVQLVKLSVNGSRSARTDIDPAAEFSPEQAARLIPTDQFATRTLPQMPNPLKDAMGDYFTANVLRN